MIHHDLTYWPVVITIARGAMTRDDHVAFLGEWTRWLASGKQFATLRLFADGDALAHPDGAAAEAKAWLRANAERIRSQVIGMATIVPVARLERVSRMNAEKLFEVPAQSFGGVDDALAWLMQTVMSPNDQTFDRDAIRAKLLGSLGSPQPRNDRYNR